MPEPTLTPEQAPGTRPAGTNDEASAARAVQQMFDSIAPRYDLLNHILSGNIDRWWWRKAARTFRHILQRPGARVLDLCCGTGDMARALRKQSATGVSILGADFAHQMLSRGAEKFAQYAITPVEADGLDLPLPASSVDLVTSAFGFRNLANYDKGLREIARVLKPGGEAGILDFGEPSGAVGVIFHLYFRHVLPKIGAAISGVEGPYAYLPASVSRFPSPEQMLERMRAAGFGDVSWTPYTFGIVGLYRGKKN